MLACGLNVVFKLNFSVMSGNIVEIGEGWYDIEVPYHEDKLYFHQIYESQILEVKA